MKKRIFLVGSVAIISAVFAVSGQPAAQQQPSTPAASPQRALLDQYCVSCHNQRAKAAGIPQGRITLDDLDPLRVSEHPEEWEKVVRRLRSGMMPPAGARRPDAAANETFTAWLENELDRNAVHRLPPPGIHRLNRTEYANVIQDLLSLEIDTTKFLPADDSTRGFDNIAGALQLSPALLEAYISAAGKISRLAVGNVNAPSQTVYRLPEDATQNYPVEGMSFGTRGGMLVRHEFPADGEYSIRIIPITRGNMGNNTTFGEIRGEKLEVLLDGERVELVDWDRGTARGQDPAVKFAVKAGIHSVGVTFLATNFAPTLDINDQFLRSTIETGGIPGFTFFPHVGSFRIDGPYNAAGADDTPSRRRIFTCRPANAGQETACARQILSTLARRAFRRPATTADVATLMQFYENGRAGASFDSGIEMALRRILADPKFIYRLEVEPANVVAGKPYRISDLELASRLSFFLWSANPDDELINLASQGRLKDPAVLERQVRRMVADPRGEEFVSNFAGQWLNLRGLTSQQPVVQMFPDFDDNLRQAFRRETELLFDSIVKEDRNIIDLLTADYTFVNERLARHYGIPNIYGSHFRRVQLGPELDVRRGLLGKGSVLTVSSQPGRTSPVQRGKWVLTTLMGVNPPDPPPNVPPLKPKADDAAGNLKQPSMRERMEEHRSNPACSGCHKIMDPIGFSLENFDAVGMWRTQEDGTPINAVDQLYDGTRIEGVTGLRQAMLRYSPQFVRNVTERLMTYALGRGVEYYDMPVVRSIVSDAQRNNFRFTSLILGIVKSEPFQMNMKVQQSSNN